MIKNASPLTRLSLGLLLTGLLLTVDPANAAIQTRLSSEAPTGSLIAAAPGTETEYSNTRWYFTSDDAAGQRDIGQSFLSDTSGSLAEVTFHLSEVAPPGPGSASAGFTLKIYALSDGQNIPEGEPIFTGSGDLPDQLQGGDFLTFDLGQDVPLDADTHYAVVLSFNEPGTGQTLNFSTRHPDEYKEGVVLLHQNKDGKLAWSEGTTVFEFYAQAPNAAQGGND